MPLAFPNVGIQNMSMRLRRVVAVAESPFTLDTQVYTHQGARWEAEVSVTPLKSSLQSRSVEAFIIGLKGREGTFHIRQSFAYKHSNGHVRRSSNY